MVVPKIGSLEQISFTAGWSRDDADLPSFKDHFTLPVRLSTAFSVPSSVESNSKEL